MKKKEQHCEFCCSGCSSSNRKKKKKNLLACPIKGIDKVFGSFTYELIVCVKIKKNKERGELKKNVEWVLKQQKQKNM
jgi:hypothetical protein